MQASASHSNVSLLKTRPIAYKLGLIALVSSFLAFIIGYSTPFWVGFDVGNSETFFSYHAGLWNAPCFYSSTSCHTGILVAQIAFSFHLAGYVICMAVAVYENCKKVNPVSYHSKVLELCVFVTGITGTAGMAVFVVWYSASLSDRSFRWSMNMTSLSLAGIYCTLVLFMIGNRRRFITIVNFPVCFRPEGRCFYNHSKVASSSSSLVTKAVSQFSQTMDRLTQGTNHSRHHRASRSCQPSHIIVRQAAITKVLHLHTPTHLLTP
ncbi:hypothetical protein BsWGS_20675 [Bradybaena similaris]